VVVAGEVMFETGTVDVLVESAPVAWELVDLESPLVVEVVRARLDVLAEGEPPPLPSPISERAVAIPDT